MPGAYVKKPAVPGKRELHLRWDCIRLDRFGAAVGCRLWRLLREGQGLDDDWRLFLPDVHQ
jgi:hypothetical protein